MLTMADGWQPAVLQLLPFSSNHAGHPSSPSPSPLTPSTPRPQPSSSSPAEPGSARGFPVLAVTRKPADTAGSGSKAAGSEMVRGGGWGGAWTPSSPSSGGRVRSSSERLIRAQTFVDGDNGVLSSSSASSMLPAQQPRARSEYLPHQGARGAGLLAPGGSQGRATSTGLHSREQATCSVTDMTERLIPRVGLGPENMSPDSGAGNLRNSPYLTSAVPEASHPNGGGGNSRCLPRPAFPANALSPSNSSAAGVIGNGNVGEGRCMISKNGMWRSVSLTPGEMELKKHRDLLERVTTVHSTSGKGDSKQYHKLNIRDLPRSTTPVNDHDPDKLNMKQVIAFLQSKGKSQADAVELPRGLRSKASPKVTLPRAVKSGVFKGSSVRKPSSSSTIDILTRSATRYPVLQESGQSSPGGAPQRTESGASTLRTSASLSMSRHTTARSSKSSARDGKEPRREHREKPDSHAGGGSASKVQKKPFRLHRFLTMIPTAREPATLSSTSLPSSAGTCPLYSSVPLDPPSSSKSANKERTLCLDLASQSKTQTTQSRLVDSKHQGKAHYRLGARPRPSSLRVEQDLLEAQWKLSADFGDRDVSEKVTVPEIEKLVNPKEKKDVIRLPFVLVDSEDEESGFPSDTRRSTKSRRPGSQLAKLSQRRDSDAKPKMKNETSPETDGVESVVWPTDVKEAADSQPASQTSRAEATHVPQLHSSSQQSTSSSMLPIPAESFRSLTTVCPSDPATDHHSTEEDSSDKLPDLNENGLDHLPEDNDVTDPSTDRPTTNKKVKVNLPPHSDPSKDNVTKQKLPDYVTLSLRKERHRTRENTYMSEIAGSDVFSDDTCAARVNSESVRMSFRSDDVASLAS